MAILKSHLHHPLNDCSSPRIHLLPDFSTSVYSVDGSAHQPPLSGFAHKPCERTIVLTSRTLLRLHQRVHVMHPQGTVNSTATRTQTGFTKVRHLERTMKPSKKKKKRLLAHRTMQNRGKWRAAKQAQNYPFSKRSTQQSLWGKILQITVQNEKIKDKETQGYPNQDKNHIGKTLCSNAWRTSLTHSWSDA